MPSRLQSDGGDVKISVQRSEARGHPALHRVIMDSVRNNSTRLAWLIVLGSMSGGGLYLLAVEPHSERLDECQAAACGQEASSAKRRDLSQPELVVLLNHVGQSNVEQAALFDATGGSTIDFDQPIHELTQLAHDAHSSEVKLRVIKSFEFREESQAVDGLLDFLSDSDRAVRIAAVEALELHAQPRVLDALRQAAALERDAVVERLMSSAIEELAPGSPTDERRAPSR